MGKQFKQLREDEVIYRRLGEYQNMNDLQHSDIDAIVQLLMVMEPFHNQLESAKQLLLDQAHEEIKTKARQKKSGLEDEIIQDENELKSKKIEKSRLENEIIDIKNESSKIEKDIEVQRTSISQTLDKFEQSLTERFDRLVVEPAGILAETLANDAFLQFVLGKGKRQLDFGSSTPLSSNTPIFEIKQGPFFENAEALLTKYSGRLDLVDLDESLAVLTTAITLSGQIAVFKGHALRRALDVFTNHLAYGRCFELPLSPEIISIERIFTIGQSSDAASLGILDTAILCAATHRDLLFFLVLEGLDRAPSQYFLDTLIDWYKRGLLDILGDNLLSQRLERLWTKHNVWTQFGLAKDMIGWPSNLLLTTTVNGLADGFPVSSAALSQIMEVNAESQGNHLDSHPALLDKIACKRAGEITVNQWSEWREKAQNQDVSLITEFIISRPKNEQPDLAKQETALRVFAALCALEQSQDNALKIVQQYFPESA